MNPHNSLIQFEARRRELIRAADNARLIQIATASETVHPQNEQSKSPARILPFLRIVTRETPKVG